MSVPQKVSAAFRWSDETLKEIKKRADARKLTVSEYVKRAALGELDVTASRIEQRFRELEQRIGRLEDRADLGALG